jgi:tRNA G18 (ribose-2'-O)-methylase SpoU
VPIERISGPNDPRVADYRSVPDPELVRARGLFVAEGRLVVRRLIEDGRHRVRSLLVNDAAYRSLEPLLGRLGAPIPIYVCGADEFLGITGYDIHRGCLALAERRPPAAVDDLLASAKTIVALEAVANADNVGGVFRNAAAFGADAVLLSPACCDPLYRKAIRTSMAATLRVPFATLDGWPASLSRVRARGFTIVALTPREPSADLETFAARVQVKKLALLVGTEGEGLSADAERQADHRVWVPIRREVDSLNLAVATGIALYRLFPPR